VAATHALQEVVQEAGMPNELLIDLIDADRITEAMNVDATDRRREVERVAKAAARWGQEMAEVMPSRPGAYWEPVIEWRDNGEAALTYGRRITGTEAHFIQREPDGTIMEVVDIPRDDQP
jgi:hypothetical protein